VIGTSRNAAGGGALPARAAASRAVSVSAVSAAPGLTCSVATRTSSERTRAAAPAAGEAT
jgi:hypothetical protein